MTCDICNDDQFPAEIVNGKLVCIKCKASTAFAAPAGSVRLTALEKKILDHVNFARVDDTHRFAKWCNCKIASANNALYKLYRAGLIAIEEKGVRGRGGKPTVWSTKTNW